MTVDPLRPASPGALFTDFYQLTMLQVYFDQPMDAMAVFEFVVAACRAGAAITSPPGAAAIS
jgi:nicotinic acid phosphoribosyltransferase